MHLYFSLESLYGTQASSSTNVWNNEICKGNAFSDIQFFSQRIYVLIKLIWFIYELYIYFRNSFNNTWKQNSSKQYRHLSNIAIFPDCNIFRVIQQKIYLEINAWNGYNKSNEKDIWKSRLQNEIKDALFLSSILYKSNIFIKRGFWNDWFYRFEPIGICIRKMVSFVENEYYYSGGIIHGDAIDHVSLLNEQTHCNERKNLYEICTRRENSAWRIRSIAATLSNYIAKQTYVRL